jgi:hypothetical protein
VIYAQRFFLLLSFCALLTFILDSLNKLLVGWIRVLKSKKVNI